MSVEQSVEPDRWVVLEISDGKETVRRILSASSGDHLKGNDWKLSTDIIKEQSNNTHYIFTTEDGNVYQCKGSAEGLTTLTSGIYNIMKERDGSKTRLLFYGDPT